METDQLNWGALEAEVQKRKSSNKAYDKLRPFFTSDAMQASTDPDLDKQAVLSQVYGLTFDKDPMEIYDSFQGAANAFHGEDGLSISEQFNRISEGYNRVVPDTPKAEVQNIVNVPGVPIKVKLKDVATPEEREKGLNELFKSSKPLNQMMTFGAIKPTISETLKGLAYGMGTIVAGKAGEARLQGDMPYLTGSLIPSGIKSEPQLPITGNEMANSLDKVAKDIWSKNDTSSGMQAEWDRGNKYGMPSWWTVNIAKNLPFMAKEMVEAIPAGIGGGLVVKGAQTFLKNTPTYIKLISKLPAAVKGLVKGTPAALSATISSAPDEALMEGEMAAMRVKDAGGSDDQAKLAFYGTAKKNLALLAIDNYLGYMSAFMPGKLGKTLAVAFNMGQQGVEEIVQDEVSSREIVKALPKLYGEIMPSSTFRDFFDVIGNEEKRDAFLLALPMGLGEPVSMFTAKIMEEAATGQATPKQVFETQRLFDSEMLKKKTELETKENPTPNDIKEKELLNKYITPDGTIIDRHNFIQDHVEFVQQRNIDKAQEILDGDLAPEEMTRTEYLNDLGESQDSTLTNDELKQRWAERQVEREKGKKTALEDYVNYLRKEGKNEIVVNMIDEAMTLSKKVQGGYSQESAKNALKKAGLSGEQVITGENIRSAEEAGQDIINLYQGADYKTVAHEVAHSYSTKVLKYDSETDSYADVKLNTDLDTVYKLYQDRGIYAPPNRNELFSKLSEDYLEGNLNESFLSKIPQTLRNILEAIKKYITGISKSAQTFKELSEKGEISPEIITHLQNAVQGKLNKDNVIEIVNKNPEVQKAVEVVEQVAEDVGIPPKQVQSPYSKFKENFMKQSPVTAWIDAHAKISAPPKDYKGGEYDGYKQNLANKFPFRNFFMGGQAAHNRPDQVAQMLADENLIADAMPETMWEALEGEIGAWKNLQKDNKEYEKVIKGEEVKLEQKENFERDTDKKDRFNPIAFTVNDLNVGDSIVVKRVKGKDIINEKLTVKEIDPDTMDVTLEDGDRYGIQTVGQEEVHYAAKVQEGKKEANASFQFAVKEEELKSYLENPEGNLKIGHLPKSILDKLNKPDKAVILKSNIVTDKNKTAHPDLNINDDITILTECLSNPEKIIHSLPKTRPYYYSFIVESNKQKQLQIELSLTKDNYEIVGWHYTDKASITRQEKRANREGGDILTRESFSTFTPGLLSGGSINSSNKTIDQSSEKSNSPSNTSFQFASLPEITEQYIQSYDKLRKAQNIFRKFGADYHLEKAHEVINHILGRVEEITGKVAPINQPIEQVDSYIRGAKARVRHMKTDAYATEKFIENLRNGSIDDIKYMADELKRMSKQVTALGYESGNLEKASAITRDDINKLQEQLTAIIKTLPREVQAFAVDKLNTLGRQKTEADAKKYLDTAIKAIEGIREKNLAYEQRGEMYDWLKLSSGKVNQSGRLAGKAVTADAIKLLRQIKEVVDISENDVAVKMTALEAQEEMTPEQEDEYTFLQIFGALKEKTPQEIAIAHSQIAQIVENGKLERKVKDQALREQYQKQSEKVVNEITAGKGLLEGKEAEERATKQERYWWKMAQGPFNYMFKHDRFSFMLNALTRKNKNVGSNQSYLKKLFNSRVNAATQSEKTEVRNKETAYRENLMRITGSKSNRELYKWYAEQNKRVQTNIVKNITEQKVQSYTLDEAFNFVSAYLKEGKLPQGMYVKPSDMEKLSTQVDMALDRMKRGEEYKQEFILNMSIDKGTPWKMTISKAQARVLWMTKQNEEMSENLYFNGYSDVSFAELDKFLDDTDKAVCNWMLEQYGKNYEKMDKVYEELFNIPMPQVKNYSPFKAKYNKGGNSGSESKASTFASMTSGGQIASTANPKSTIKRVSHYRDLDIDNVNADNMYLQSIRESAHFVNWGVLARDLRGVFKKENVRNAIKETFNASKMSATNHIIDSLIRGGTLNTNQIAEVDAMRGMVCKLILSGKGPNLFKQMTGHAAIMGEMSVKDYVKYTGQFFANPIANTKEVMEHEYLNNRWYNGFSQDLNNVLEKSKGKLGNWFNQALEMGMFPTRFGDMIPSVAGYYAAYKSCLAQGMNDADARIEAGDIIDRTQQASNTKDLGYYQLQGSWMNLTQMFLTANRLYMTNIYDAMADTFVGKEGAGKRLGKKLLIYNVLCPLLYQAVGDVCKIAISALAGGDDYEPEWEDYAVAMLTGPASGLWVVGNMFTWGARKSFGQYASTPQIIPGVGSLVESAYKTSKDIVTGEDWQKTISDAIAPTGAGWLKPFVKEEK